MNVLLSISSRELVTLFLHDDEKCALGCVKNLINERREDFETETFDSDGEKRAKDWRRNRETRSSPAEDRMNAIASACLFEQQFNLIMIS